MPPPSTLKPRLRQCTRHAISLFSNLILNQSIPSFAPLLALIHLPPLSLTLLTAPLHGRRLRFTPTACDFLAVSQRRCVVEPEATCLSSVGPFVLFCTSLTSTEFFVAAPNLSSSSATDPDKVVYFMMKHFSL